MDSQHFCKKYLVELIVCKFLRVLKSTEDSLMFHNLSQKHDFVLNNFYLSGAGRLYIERLFSESIRIFSLPGYVLITIRG